MDERGPWTGHLTKLRQILTKQRSAEEVDAILTSFIDGEPTGHGVDDFITVPIRDSVLDNIRADFEQLVDRVCSEWEPQRPFPIAGLADLRVLIERARAASGQPPSN
jgi:hypothetical protein